MLCFSIIVTQLASECLEFLSYSQTSISQGESFRKETHSLKIHGADHKERWPTIPPRDYVTFFPEKKRKNVYDLSVGRKFQDQTDMKEEVEATGRII